MAPSPPIHPPAAANGARAPCQPAVFLPLKAGFGTHRGKPYRAPEASVVGFLLSTLAAATENALAATSDLLENADSTLRARRPGTMARSVTLTAQKVSQQRVAFGSVDVDLPDFLIGEMHS